MEDINKKIIKFKKKNEKRVNKNFQYSKRNLKIFKIYF